MLVALMKSGLLVSLGESRLPLMSPRRQILAEGGRSLLRPCPGWSGRELLVSAVMLDYWSGIEYL